MWAKLVLGGSTKEERAEGLSRLKDQPQGWGGGLALYFLCEQSKWRAKD